MLVPPESVVVQQGKKTFGLFLHFHTPYRFSSHILTPKSDKFQCTWWHFLPIFLVRKFQSAAQGITMVQITVTTCGFCTYQFQTQHMLCCEILLISCICCCYNLWSRKWLLNHPHNIIMAALCNRARHYVMFLPCGFFFQLLLSSFPRLISAVADWMSTILPHTVWP